MIYRFAGYELDTRLFELRESGKPCHVEPQVFDLLAFLVQNRARVVTKEELLDAIWGTQFITEATLSSRLMAARKAIGDDGQAQRSIKTLRGRGFRFVGTVEEENFDRMPPQEAASPEVENAPQFPFRPAPAPENAVPVGREIELHRLREYFRKTKTGARQVVFVTGEAGAGKTTLLGSFLSSLRAEEPVGIVCCQCLEQHGAPEAYMPVLDALDRLCRQPDGVALIALLQKCAPTWLVQMPWLLSSPEFQELETATRGATRERMLREMVQTFEAMAENRPLIVVFEDLHWSDISTLDLLSWTARRSQPARLLLLGTFRATDLPLEHPLRNVVQELRIRGHSAEFALRNLDTDSVRQYLISRFPQVSLPDDIAAVLHERTGGNPLFMRNVVDAWLSAGLLVETDDGLKMVGESTALAQLVPENLRQLIEQQLTQLDGAQQSLLEAAAVAGMQFATVTVAATGADVEDTEKQLLELARREKFIEEREITEWPDGTASTQFGFSHHLYQKVLYDRIPFSRRQRLHTEIATRLERFYGRQVQEIASQLADHYTRARNPRAVEYLQLAAGQALRRSAYSEASQHLSLALALLQKQPDDVERSRREVLLQNTAASALIATEGWGSPAAADALQRAHKLATQLGETESLAMANYGLASLLEFRGEFVASQQLMEERLTLLEDLEGKLQSTEPFVETYDLLACSCFHQGKFDEAVQNADAGIDRYDPRRHSDEMAAIGEDLGVACHYWAALSLWYLGDLEHARARIGESLALAQTPDRAYCLASALTQSAMLHQLQGDVGEVQQLAQEIIGLATDKGFPYRIATGKILHGWAVAIQESCSSGVREIEEGLSLCHAAGIVLDDPYYLTLLAEAFAATNEIENALGTLNNAMKRIQNGRTFYHEAELHRLKGNLLLRQGSSIEAAEAHLKDALTVARQQNAKSLELRALTDLHRVRPTATSRRNLQKALVFFGKDLESRDLREARNLLN